jgi:glucose-6-phosphate isomerase
MVNFKGLDACDSFTSLKKTSRIRLHDLVTPSRLANWWIPHAAELSYCYAFAPVDDLIVERLQALADEQQLIEKYRMLAEGAIMNTGEGRMVLHHLARGRLGAPVIWKGQDMEIFYRDEKLRFYEFAEKVRDGRIRSSADKPFAQVVQIGIGGSDLGPRAASLALSRWAIVKERAKLTPWFISNVDPDDGDYVLSRIDLSESLFVLVSKSGTTQETLANEMLVRERLKAVGLNPDKHIVAVTSKSSPLAGNPHYLDSFFIDDFIGGRYSTSSAVGGVIISIAYGPETFEEFLQGAHGADTLALEPSLKHNPVLMDAMIGVYERNVLGWPATAVLPYAEPLSRFPAHLQQLDMESNGKSVSRAGQPLSYSTGPVVFGEPGTNGQHSFYQLLHQGTDIVPLQFIGFLKNQLSSDMSSEGSSSRQKLVSNLVAQMMAFALGKEDENPNKAFPGGRPSTLLVGEELGPRQLGALFSHFENKVMFQGFTWNINSFDQEGVQLGKVLAKKALGAISKGDSSGDVRLDALIAAVYENTRRRDRADR